MKRTVIGVQQKVLDSNDQVAQANRQLFAQHHVAVLNLIGSPGAGKTTLLLATLSAMSARMRFAVIEGDLATTQDADKVAALGVPVYQINTDGACHLSARHVARAVGQLDLAAADVLLIENVGNLVCPAGFDLGEHAKVAVVSMPEGDDKPSKYPGIFARAAAVAVTKADLASHVDFDVARVRRDVGRLNSRCEVMVVSARTGRGMQAWCDWLARFAAACRAPGQGPAH